MECYERKYFILFINTYVFYKFLLFSFQYLPTFFIKSWFSIIKFRTGLTYNMTFNDAKVFFSNIKSYNIADTKKLLFLLFYFFLLASAFFFLLWVALRKSFLRNFPCTTKLLISSWFCFMDSLHCYGMNFFTF